MGQALGLIVRLTLRLKKEAVQRIGIKAAGIHEIMHQQDTTLGTVLVEAVRLISTAAPHAEHSKARGLAFFYQSAVGGIGRTQIDGVSGDPVAALAEYPHSVYTEEEIPGTVGELRMVDLHCAHTHLFHPVLHGVPHTGAAGVQFIEILFPVAVGPPKFCLLQFHLFLSVIEASHQQQFLPSLIDGLAVKQKLIL